MLFHFYPTLHPFTAAYYLDSLVDKLCKNNFIQNYLSNVFECYWQIPKHTVVATITSKRKMKFNGTLALKLDTLRQ